MRLRLSLFLLVALGLPSAAGAYPQWQFSSGTTRCNQCHFSPGGGGLITGYGRDAAGEELSTWQGDGGFLHGKVELPDWLALGLDARGAVLSHHAGNSEGPTNAAFPMQADAYGRAAFGQLSLYLNLGYRGQARGASEPLGQDNPRPVSASRIASREHYLMWRAAALGPYVRAGRFHAPYGLRLAEHTAYVRRDTGFNLFEETYGASAGIIRSAWEAHLTAFLPDGLREMGGRERGVALMAERRLAGIAALGLSARTASTDDARRHQGGPFAKAYVEVLKTFLMAEVNVVNWQGSSGGSANQLVGLAGVTVFPVRGLWVGAFLEHNQTDIRVRGTATEAASVQINWFPYPHFELVLLGRVQAPSDVEAARTLMFQVHYYL